MSLFFAFAALQSLAVASPGPDFVLVTRNSLLFGRHTGMWTTVGITLAVGIHVLGCFLGMGAFATQFPALLRFVQLAGAAYLAAIGVRMLLSKHTQEPQMNHDAKAKKHISAHKAFQMGLLCNLLNPKAGLFFWTVWAQFISWDPSMHLQIALALYIVISSWAWFTTLSMLLSSRAVAERMAPWQNRISRLGGLILLGFALSIGLTIS